MAEYLKDTLFLKKDIGQFQFDADVVAVYEDMVRRSVPFYDEINDMCIHILEREISADSLVVDLGCSVGLLIKRIQGQLERRHFQVIGYDNSPPMMEQARASLSGYPRISLKEKEIQEFDEEGVSAVISNFTIQFIPETQRPPLLKKIYQSLKNSGVFIFSEKVASNDEGSFNKQFYYHQFKAKNGYSTEEIQKKDLALRGVLRPVTLHQNIEWLHEAGFSNVEVIFKWYNFCTLVGIKK